MSLRRLTGPDAIFLAVESENNHMHMMAVMVLDPSSIPGGYSFEKVRDFIGSRLQMVPPLCRRLVEVPFGLERPLWIEDVVIDLDRHIRRAAVPSPGGPREIAAMAGEMNSRALDRRHPLWEIVIVEGCADGEIALLAKLHHSLMDGMAGMQFFAALVSGEPESKAPPTRKRSRQRVPGAVELLAGAVPGLVTKPLQIARVGQDLLRAALAGMARERPEAPRAAPTVERHPLLNQGISPDRSAAYTSLPLDRVKAVGRAYSATVNEVMLAVVGGALRKYLEGQGEAVDVPIVAMVPISTHAGDGDDLTNSVAGFTASLGSEIEDPVDRLNAVRGSSHDAKDRNPSLWGGAIMGISELPSPALLKLIARITQRLKVTERMTPFCNVVVSSVPGPPTDIYFAGAKILDLYPLGPIYDGGILNITAISVTGTLDFGLSACRQALPDLWELADGLGEALEELEARMPRSQERPASLHVAEIGGA